MLYPGSGGRGAGPAPTPPAVRVTLRDGQVVTGTLAYRDEFTISITDADGWRRSWPAQSGHLHRGRSAAGARRAAGEIHRCGHARCAGLSADAPLARPRSSLRRGGDGCGAERGSLGAAEAAHRQLAHVSRRLLGPSSQHASRRSRRPTSASSRSPGRSRPDRRSRSRPRRFVANGVVYVTTPDNLWAIDARSGRQIWRYTYPMNDGFHIGHRGAAVSKDLVYLTTPDAHLLALDARDGTVKWDVVIADAKKGYWSTNAPLLIRNHLIVGVSGDFDNLPGILRSFDADTGTPQWTFYSTPPPDTPGSVSGGATGGQMWMTGTYDPELESAVRRHRQPDAGAQRRGAARRQPLDRLDRGAQSRHRHDGVGLPGLAARYPRLGRRRSAGARGRRVRRRAAQAAAPGVAQRLLLRARPHHRQEPADDAVRHRQLGERRGRGRTPDAQPGQGTGARRAPRRARRGRRHQLPIAELRPGHRSADRQRARRLRHLFLQEGARPLRLGGGRLHGARARRAAGARLPHRSGALEPRPARRRRGGRRAHHRGRRDLHRRLRQQRDGAADERRRDAVALRASAAWATRRSPTNWTGGSTCCSAAAARSTPSRSRCRDEEEHEPARPVDTRSMDGRPGAGGARATRPGPGGTGGAARRWRATAGAQRARR